MARGSMRAAVLTAPGRISPTEVPRTASERDAVIRVTQVGICGSDRAFMSGAVRVDMPRILGHEIVGVVVDPGHRGSPPAGTRVLVDPSIACCRCPTCLLDRPHLCPAGTLIGRDTDGGLAEFVVVPESQLHVLRPEITDDQAAVLQVLSTCVHSLATLGKPPSGSAIVIGLGVTGLLHAQLLLDRGHYPVLGIDPDPHKRAVAAELGCLVRTPTDAAAAAGDLNAPLVVETAGKASSFTMAVDFVAPGGTVIAFALGPGTDVPSYDMYLKEITIRYPRAARPQDLTEAIAVAHRVVRAPMVSTRFALDDVEQAIAASIQPGVLKVVVEP